jgi:hypothetical protein
MRTGIVASLALSCCLGMAVSARAASSAIDPDPFSPTIGDILDREAAQRRASMRPPPAAPVERIVSSHPVIPAGATTVIVPGVRPRGPAARPGLPRR